MHFYNGYPGRECANFVLQKKKTSYAFMSRVGVLRPESSVVRKNYKDKLRGSACQERQDEPLFFQDFQKGFCQSVPFNSDSPNLMETFIPSVDIHTGTVGSLRCQGVDSF